MKKLRETPWFSRYAKPLKDRIGVYKRDYSKVSGSKEDFRWCWWDGEFFGRPALQPVSAIVVYLRYGISSRQDLPWQGVIK